MNMKNRKTFQKQERAEERAGRDVKGVGGKTEQNKGKYLVTAGNAER